MIAIAEAKATTGDSDDAVQSFDEALRIAVNSEDDLQHSRILVGIARSKMDTAHF